MSGVGWSIELPLLRLNEVICEAERAGGAGHTVLVIPHDPREPVAISLDGKPISHPESPERVVSVAMMMRNVEAGPALPRTPDAAHREHDAHAGTPCGQRWDLHTMAPHAPGEQPRVICPGARTARPPLTAAEVEGMLEYGKIRREVPATSLTAEELEERIAAWWRECGAQDTGSLAGDADLAAEIGCQAEVAIYEDDEPQRLHLDTLCALWLVRRRWSVSEPPK